MVRGININRNLAVALLLGVAVLFANYLASILGSQAFYVPIGNVFLFLSAETLGFGGVMVTFAIGILAETLASGKYLELLRLLVLSAALGYSARKWPRVPGFAVALTNWLFIFGPALFYFRTLGNAQWHMSSDTIFFTGLTEVLLVMISGTLLLSSRIWGTLSSVPRHVSASSFLVHVITCISTLAMFGALSVTLGAPVLNSENWTISLDFWGLIAILVVGISVPAVLAWRLAVVVSDNFQELFSSGFLTGGAPTKSFSGLSSEYWRRQNQPDRPPNRSITDLPSTPKASGEQAVDSTNKLLSPDQGLCAVNRNGTITFVNRRFRKFCEIHSNDILGKNLANIEMNAVLCKKILLMLEDTFTKGPRTLEVKVNQLPEKLRFYELKSYRSDAFEGSSLVNGPDSAIFTIKDITDKRTVESHLLQAQKLESLGSLVEGVAHTFNNALTTIIGQASFARKSNDTAHIQRSLSEILKTAFGSGLVVRQLLDFASGRPSHMKAEHLEKVLGERMDLLRRLAGDVCEIEYIQGTLPTYINCDTNLILQALTNLVLNAKESYTDQSGKISISLDQEHLDEAISELNPGTRPGNFARVRVKDVGSGMSSETLAKAFDPLFTTKSATGHTGLGLSIAFAIVRAHDGFLTAESHPEKGTTVSLYFPLLDEKPAELSPSTDDRKSPPAETSLADLMGNKEKILVVEDEKTVRELLTTMLSTLGYQVTSCIDGEEAYDRANKEGFDLILIDAVIPKLKGVDLLAKLKEAGVKSKCLLMSGYGSSLQTNGATEKVIHKPFDLDTLGKAIKTSLTIQ